MPLDRKVRTHVTTVGRRIMQHDLEVELTFDEDGGGCDVLVSDRLQTFVLADHGNLHVLMVAIQAAIEEVVGVNVAKGKVQ